MAAQSGRQLRSFWAVTLDEAEADPTPRALYSPSWAAGLFSESGTVRVNARQHDDSCALTEFWTLHAYHSLRNADYVILLRRVAIGAAKAAAMWLVTPALVKEMLLFFYVTMACYVFWVLLVHLLLYLYVDVGASSRLRRYLSHMGRFPKTAGRVDTLIELLPMVATALPVGILALVLLSVKFAMLASFTDELTRMVWSFAVFFTFVGLLRDSLHLLLSAALEPLHAAAASLRASANEKARAGGVRLERRLAFWELRALELLSTALLQFHLHLCSALFVLVSQVAVRLVLALLDDEAIARRHTRYLFNDRAEHARARAAPTAATAATATTQPPPTSPALARSPRHRVPQAVAPRRRLPPAPAPKPGGSRFTRSERPGRRRSEGSRVWDGSRRR